jgi:hypothetical protein
VSEALSSTLITEKNKGKKKLIFLKKSTHHLIPLLTKVFLAYRIRPSFA